MNKPFTKHFIQAVIRSEESLSHPVQEINDSERLQDLELAVTRLASTLTKDPPKELAKLYATMLTLKRVEVDEVPVPLREEVQAVLDNKKPVGIGRKEVSR